MGKRYKLDPERYLDDIYVVLVDSTKEVQVMTAQGVVRAKSIKSKQESAAWEV